MEMAKEAMPEKMEDTAEAAAPKTKRDSFPYHYPTPCPPHYSGWNKGWQPQYVQPAYVKPVVPIVKTGWSDPWQADPWKANPWQVDPWKANPWQADPWKVNPWGSSYGSGYGYGYPKYSKPYSPYAGWQSPSVYHKPLYNSYPHSYGSSYYKPHYNSYAHSYAPAYHKPLYNSYAPQYHVPNYHTNLIKPAVIVKPDCPPEPHYHSHHTGIVYAPHHQSYHHPEPNYVKVIKPAYHAPAPYYHHPAPVHYPKVELCD
ncbi:hypothetical protein QAD02_008691 [Eretmocerus hayati]|uniref:Uncharacterized protein n=1 Tax=Eretmocerus hayati TaxID=131215 RepID=A0ACC2N753_9HYME|nr:hypothetical protein QAD02_008691 [Eretmocerus hayati]